MTANQIRPLQLRKVLGHHWTPPVPYGPDGWRLDDIADGVIVARVIVAQAPPPTPNEGPVADLTEWIHASMSCHNRVPTYEEMCVLHRAVWGNTGESYEIHAPRRDHININPNVLHLWGRADGKRVLPNFGHFGTI